MKAVFTSIRGRKLDPFLAPIPAPTRDSAMFSALRRMTIRLLLLLVLVGVVLTPASLRLTQLLASPLALLLLKGSNIDNLCRWWWLSGQSLLSIGMEM